MDRAIPGFIVGFFLAVFLVMAAIRLELGQWEQQMATLMPAAQGLYDLTHGADYQDMKDFAVWANDTADKVSGIPLLGAMVPSGIPEAANSVLLLLQSGKQASESMLATLQLLQFTLQISVPVMVVSLVFVAAGAYLLAQKGKGR